jgi:nucleoside phosphorylase
MPCAVILTALSVEYLAVRKHLANLTEVVNPNGTIYERGDFVAEHQTWEIGIVEVGAGNAGAALEVELAIAGFQPDVILFIGIAGGIKDVKLGDVVASTKIYGYESGKSKQDFQPRPAISLSGYNLEQRARAEARKSDWLKRLDDFTLNPHVLVAPIAAGEKVVPSTKSKMIEFLRLVYGDAVAVEMEGFGFLEAARANPQVSTMVIRGISDLLHKKSEVNTISYQKMAANNASAFAFEVLAKLSDVSNDRRIEYQSLTNTTGGRKSLKVFISYSHQDIKLLNELKKWLFPLEQQGLIESWHDQQVVSGDEWSHKIASELDNADIILLLISPDFMASKYCYEREMRRAMERHAAGEARVIPIMLRPIDLGMAPFNILQSLPTRSSPVTNWADRDQAFLNIAKGIRAVVEELINPGSSGIPVKPPTFSV